MVLGNAPSQPRWAFQGCSERFSDSASVVLQAVKSSVAAANKRHSFSALISVNDLIAFFDFAEIPSGQRARDAAVLEDFADTNLSD